MPPFAESLTFLIGQTGCALYAMIAFILGAASAWVVIYWEVEPLERFALWLLKCVTWLVGQRPTMLRLFVIIWGFNSTAMFVYMCTGVWVVLPALVCFLTGMNLAIIFVRGPAAAEGSPLIPVPAASTLDAEEGPALGVGPMLCGLLVVLLELPAFWYSIGMGISLGHFVQEHFSSIADILLLRLGSPAFNAAFEERAAAYVQVIVPVLFVSALAEAYAVREASRAVQEGSKEKGEGAGEG